MHLHLSVAAGMVASTAQKSQDARRVRLRRASASEGEVASTATMVTQAHLNALAVRTPKHLD